MNNITTRDKGIQATKKIIKQLGATMVESPPLPNNRKIITFSSPIGREFELTTRAKTSGTWQTSTDYGKTTKEKKDEKKYWVFVDLSKDPNEFYVVPLWWIQNDIDKAHKDYLAANDGSRPFNDKSKHHGIPVERIKRWHNRWDLLGFK